MEEFDYVIVGAGSAGCVLGARLSEDGATRVLLLEAGGSDRHPFVHIPAAFPRLFDSSRDWRYRTEPQEHLGGRRLYFPRGKMIGGSSSINAMMWIRGFAADYDHWAEKAGPQWSYQSVLPYFHKSEDGAPGDPSYGIGGPIPVVSQRDENSLTRRWRDAASEVGLRIDTTPNSGVDDGIFSTRVTQRAGRRVSAADAYLARARTRKNLVVKSHALCTSIDFEGTRAVGVSYETHGRPSKVRARREVLLAAGAINSPQLLMCSGIGPAGRLRELGIEVLADRSEVGKNLQDHLTAGFAVATNRSGTLSGAQTPKELARYLLFHRGLLTSNVAEGYGYARSDSSLELCDLELIFVPGPFVDEGLRVERRHGITFGAVLLQPESRGEVTISSPDARKPALIDPMFLSDPAGKDATRLRAGIEMCLSLSKTKPFAGLLGERLQPAISVDDELVESSLYRYSQTLYHPIGTARMGSDEASVVDPELRVRGVEGLRVIDASVMPQIPRAHTHAPTVMIAEKAADMLRAEQARGSS